MASEESAIRPASGKLSKNLLALKFMQRQVEADKRQELEQQRIRHEAEAKWGQNSCRREILLKKEGFGHISTADGVVLVYWEALDK
eukprot:m.39131 g.39131  ORF g.39131 m.39131 type:complete len:86 (-) comp12640_c0_seq4:832-1089(-)